MKQLLSKTIKYLLRFLWAFAGLIITYLLAAVVFTIIPANSDAKEPEEGISIYLISNGFHMDLVLPVENEVYNWKSFIDFSQFKEKVNPSHLAFGWGDKGFFYDTPTIEDLSFSTTVNALFLPSASVMHVIMLGGKPSLNDSNKEVKLTKEQYQELVNHILSGFELDDDGKVQQHDGDGYGHIVDNFYVGKGSYSLFTTCNDWINIGLKKAGIKTAMWAPFDKCILYHRD